MNRSKITDIKLGDRLSEIQYYKVVEILPAYRSIRVKNERGMEFTISDNIVAEGIFTANQFNDEETITKTQMAELFSSIGDTVFTVVFNKQLKEKDAREAIIDLYPNKGKITSEKDYIKEVKKIMKSAIAGEERTLVGYKIGTDKNLGRSHVIDLEQEIGTNPEWDARQRQVDHRTIRVLIHKNVKYTVK